MRRPYPALIASLLLGGCATPSRDLIVLLPDKEGKVGTVVVQSQKGKAVLNTAYATARTTSEGGMQRGTASQSEVKELLAEMASRQAPDITVIGHTDLVGPDPSNDALSLQRAERVKSILAGMGIPAERILTAGRGRREPLIPTAEGVSEPRNRRVEINVR